MNELLLLIEVIATYICILLAIKLLQKKGLVIWLIISLILAFLMSLKSITFIYFAVDLGIILYTSNFIVLNILLQKYGNKDLVKYILMAIFALCIVILILYLGVKINNSPYNIVTNVSFNRVFTFDLRYILSFMLTYLLMALLNIKIYYYLRTTKNNILISNFYSSIIVFFIDSLLFGILNYLFKLEILDILIYIIVVTVIKYVMAWLGTIVIYLNNKVGRW